MLGILRDRLTQIVMRPFEQCNTGSVIRAFERRRINDDLKRPRNCRLGLVGWKRIHFDSVRAPGEDNKHQNEELGKHWWAGAGWESYWYTHKVNVIMTG